MTALRFAPLAALLLFFAAPVSAQFIPGLEPLAPEATEPEASGEAIQVHGRWLVTVTNPDGTQAAHYDFQNALTFEGTNVISLLLTSDLDYFVDPWRIHLLNGTSVALSIDPADAASEAGPVLPSGDTSIMSVISGSGVASADIVVDRVETALDLMAPNGGQSNVPFTRKELDTRISIQAGQTVTVRVEISFE